MERLETSTSISASILSLRERHMQMAHLPYALLCQILSRLPIKSVVRFKCVCRTWYTLFPDPFFINLHLSRSNQNPCNTPIAFLKASSLCKPPSFLNLVNLDNDLDASLRFKLLPNHFIRLSSCLGLLCLIKLDSISATPYSIDVCNAISKQYISLPQDPYQSFDRSMMPYAFGIGFDAATKQYKVVKILLWCRIPQDEKEAAIWTLGCSMSWRHIGKIPYSTESPPTSTAGFYIQGALHWWMDFNRSAIVSMNMGSEEFCVIDLPFESDSWIEMMGWNGRLVAVECGDSNHGYCFNIWVLKDHPRKESWSKELSIEWKSENLMPHPHLKYRYSLLCIQKNGEILVLNVEKHMLVSYMEKRSFMCIKSLPHTLHYIGCAISYPKPSWMETGSKTRIEIR